VNAPPTLRFPCHLDPAGHDVVVVDVEGNGQQPPEIVEIALLPLTAGRDATAADLQTWLVRPARPIMGLVTRKVHGISNADVATAPRWDEVAGAIATVLEDAVVVAHNASVERRVLAEHLPAWRPPLLLDTMRLARAEWPDLPGGYSLDNLIRHAALTPPTLTGVGTEREGMRRHRAGYDAWMTAAVLVTLVRDGELDWDQLVAAARLPDPHGPATRPTADAQDGLW
jgi:DNA polymerase III epsilon subunit-like protein